MIPSLLITTLLHFQPALRSSSSDLRNQHSWKATKRLFLLTKIYMQSKSSRMTNQRRTPRTWVGSPKQWRARVETRKQLILRPSLTLSRTWLQKCPSSNNEKQTHFQVAICLDRDKKKNSLSNSSSNNRFASKNAQKPMFQLEQCADPKLCSFHEEHHLKNSFSEWKRFVGFVYIHTLDVESNM